MVEGERTDRDQGATVVGRVFFLAFIGGAVSIVLGTQFENGLVTVGVPIIVLLGYFFYGQDRTRAQISTAQFADTVYYLGFLFTLVALLASLLFFGTGDNFLTRLAPQFGLALSTTVLGLALRIYLVNFTPTQEDTAERVEEDLAATATVLRNQLEQLNVDMVARNDLINQSLTTAVTRTSQSLEKAIKKAGKDLTDMTSETRDAVKEELAVFSDLSTTAAEDAATLSEDLATKRKALLERLNETKLPADVFTDALGPAVDGLVTQLQAFDQMVAGLVTPEGERPAALTQLTKQMDATVTQLQAFDQMVAGLVTPEGKRPAALTQLTMQMDATVKELDNLQAAVQKITKALDGELTSTHSHQKALAEEYEKAEAALGLMRDQLVDIVKFIQKHV
jgi:hypothetical protein